MKYTAKQIAQYLKGEVDGDPKVKVNDISKIEEGKPGSLSFLANPKYTPYVYETDASVVLVKKDFKPEKKVKATLIRVDDPYQAFAGILKMVNESVHNKKGKEEPHFIGKDSKIGKGIYLGAFAYIGHNVKIGKNCKIYPNSYIGDNVQIGDNVTIYAGVKIYHACSIGNNCIIHAGAVIGSDGFGFAPDDKGNFHKIEQVGIVRIEDDVEIGANTTIDRATMGETLIKKGAKLDNLIQVAHNVSIGEKTVSAAQVGISGSTKVGSGCMFGGQVGIAGHLTIGDRVNIAAKAGVPGNVKSGETIMGSPAIPAREFKRSFIMQKHLPDMREDIMKLKREIAALKKGRD